MALNIDVKIELFMPTYHIHLTTPGPDEAAVIVKIVELTSPEPRRSRPYRPRARCYPAKR